jgi:hypothetical protein
MRRGIGRWWRKAQRVRKTFDNSVQCGEEADAAGLEVRGQRLELEVLEDVVAVALGDEFYVKGDWYKQERRKAENAPRNRIPRLIQPGECRATPRRITRMSLFAAVHSRKYV